MIQVSAALIATLSAETGLLKGRLGQPLDRSQSRGAQDDTDELDRTWEDQDERRWAGAAPYDEVVKEAEAVAVEGEAVDFPEVDADRKDEGTLRDGVTEEVLVLARGAPQTGWRVDRFPQGPGRMRLVSTQPWSLRPPTCEPELWLIIGKAAQRER